MTAKSEVRKVVRQKARSENGLKAMISNSRERTWTRKLTFGGNEGADIARVGG